MADSENSFSADPWADYGKPLDGDEGVAGSDAFGNVKQLYIHKKKNRNLKTLLSIGGFDNSKLGKFNAASNTTAGRKRFAASAVKMLADYGFDGLDIDWEYPEWNAQGENLYLLLKECRTALDEYAAKNNQNYHYELSIATSANYEYYRRLPFSKINNVVDSVQLMSYDYAGDWDKTTGHASNIYPDPSNPEATKFSTSKPVTDYIKNGLASNKILLGVPLYGRSFANTHGLGKTYSGTGKGSIDKGVWLFKDLPRPGAKVATRTDIIAMYTYDSKTTEYVTLDGGASVKLKATWLKNQKLGGAFFWEASGDKTGTSSLVRIMAEGVGALAQSQNQLDYPESQFDNIRNGMPEV